MAFQWSEQRLRGRIQMEVEPEVDDDQALELGIARLVAAEEMQDERFASEHGAFQPAAARIGKNWIGPAQSEQITMHLVDFGMLLALGEVEFALAKCFFGLRIDQNGFAFRARDT